MSREAILKTVEKMRSATDAGMSEMMFRKDAIRVVHQLADQVEADVADILAENARLKAALKPVLDVGWVEKRYNYCSGTVPTKDLYLVVREAQEIYNGGAK